MDWNTILDTVGRAYADPSLSGHILRIATILLAAWLASGILGRLLPGVVFALRPRWWRTSTSAQRIVTLRELIASMTAVVSALVALALILALYISPSGVALLGLFSAAVGIAARPLIADVLTGITLLFEDQFTVGEKVELTGALGMNGVMGIVERVGARTTHIRADSGELFIIPNGDVRVIRNFSRGEFSIASITAKVRSDRVSEALSLLESIGRAARTEITDIVEDPMVLSETGTLGEETELTLKVKTRLGQGAAVRAALLARAQQALAEKGIHVVIP
jgi:small conductance mechanosensitive channel